jgi:DeoR/GlpR family transcriptional regulator of sugar metabolism
MEAASRCVLLTTSSKYGTFGMYKVAGLEQFDTIISDEGLAQAAAESIRAHGVELLLASVEKNR